MAICPFAVQRPVSAHGGLVSSVIGVVIHVTAGEGDPYNEFANPANQVSSHFGIGNGQGGMADGLIEQYVDTGYQSWAQAAGNANYISVETEGQPADLLTPGQVTAFARIMAWVNQTYKVPLATTDTPGQPGLITHGDGGQAWGGHIGCPGDLRKAQRTAILSQAQALITPPAPTPSTSEGDIVGWTARDTDSGGFWATDHNGDLNTQNGAPFIAALSQHPEWHAGDAESGGTNPCVGIEAWRDPNGKTGIVYVTRLGGNQDQSGLHFYRFRRDGTPD